MSALKFGDNIDLQQNQLYNAIAQVLSSAPSSPMAGQFYYDSTVGALMVRNASAFVPADASKLSNAIPYSALVNAAGLSLLGNSTGSAASATSLSASTAKTLLAIIPSDISGFDTQVRTSRLDQMAAPTANVAMGGHKLTGLAAPTATGDAATWDYVNATSQAAASGLDVKNSAQCASTANIATLSGLTAIDGYTPVAGDRILLKNQTTASANGIYVAAAGSWTRSADGVQGELTSGALILVTNGTVNAATQWYLQTADPITIGTTSLVFTQFGASATYSAASAGGLSLTGSAFSVKLPTASGLVEDSTGLYVDTNAVPMKYSTSVGDGSSIAIVVTHNLNTRDVRVSLRSAASPYDEVITTNEATSVNTITLRFAAAPTSGQYRVTILG